MRRSFPPVLALTVAMLVGGVARAQITLVPGPPQLVARAPEFIAAGDFNGDGFDDAAVINPGSDKVTVLFGSADGSFSSLIDLAVGRRLENIAAADLNSDNKADIAVATNFQRLVYRIPGNGDTAHRALAPRAARGNSGIRDTQGSRMLPWLTSWRTAEAAQARGIRAHGVCSSQQGLLSRMTQAALSGNAALVASHMVQI